MFEPLRTKRLLIRQAVPLDASLLSARRSDPEVARYQNWTVPYTLDQARALVDEVSVMQGPQNEEWWMGSVCDSETGEVLGDLAVHLTWERRSAEIGYTFATEHWGMGYATEATTALVRYLFEEIGVTRVFGMLHPDNSASAMVLERTGLLYEGHTRSSFWVGGEVSDDLIYGMTRSDWDTWRNRPTHQPETVEFVPVTVENADEVSTLRTHKSQERFVAPMQRSYVDALFPEVVDGAPVAPWLRGVKADGEYVGFVMLALITEHHPEPFLWRLLIDRLHQRRGIGNRILEMTFEECRRSGAASLLISWGEGKGSPRPFYLQHGFVPTGRVVDGETEARIKL